LSDEIIAQDRKLSDLKRAAQNVTEARKVCWNSSIIVLSVFLEFASVEWEMSISLWLRGTVEG